MKMEMIRIACNYFEVSALTRLVQLELLKLEFGFNSGLSSISLHDARRDHLPLW